MINGANRYYQRALWKVDSSWIGMYWITEILAWLMVYWFVTLVLYFRLNSRCWYSMYVAFMLRYSLWHNMPWHDTTYTTRCYVTVIRVSCQGISDCHFTVKSLSYVCMIRHMTPSVTCHACRDMTYTTRSRVTVMSIKTFRCHFTVMSLSYIMCVWYGIWHCLWHYHAMSWHIQLTVVLPLCQGTSLSFRSCVTVICMFLIWHMTLSLVVHFNWYSVQKDKSAQISVASFVYRATASVGFHQWYHYRPSIE